MVKPKLKNFFVKTIKAKVLYIFSVTPNQIERLYSRFTSLDRGNCGTLSREDLLRIPELAINPLGDRIVHAFFQEGNGDSINFLQFMQVLAHFRPIKKNKDTKLNSREQKLKCKYPFETNAWFTKEIALHLCALLALHSNNVNKWGMSLKLLCSLLLQRE
ncbi:hypothetical protein B566_EDAN013770 [Ephemera danica]|nr:hypothetical protein B566_EDAN013770 [Ephemera danica]